MAAAAQRNVNVIANPRAERDVPPGPEIAEAGGSVGVVEIFGKAHAEHLGEAERDVGVAAEIEENAGGERGEKEPGLGGGEGEEILFVEREGDREVVGEQDFFAEPKGHALGAGGDIGKFDAAEGLGQGGGEILIAFDWAGDERRKINREERELLGAADRRMAAGHVDEVVDEFEGKETQGERRDRREPGGGDRVGFCAKLRSDGGDDLGAQKVRVFVADERDDAGGDRAIAEQPVTAQGAGVGERAEHDDGHDSRRAGEVGMKHGAPAEQPPTAGGGPPD